MSKTRTGLGGVIDESPPSDRGSATLERVLRTSTELFAERGFYGTSMRQLAERGGMVLSGFYYYFRSKYDVLLAIIDKAVTMVEEAADRVPADLPPEARFVGLLEGYLELHLREPKLTRVCDHEIGALKPDDLTEMRGRLNAYETLFREAIEDGIESGSFDPEIDVTVAAKSILLMATGVTEWWRPEGRLSVRETMSIVAGYGLNVVRRATA